METDVRPVDANALMARFFRKERLVQGAASAAYKDAQKTVAAAPTVSLWPEWRDPDKDPPKVEEEVLIMYQTASGECGITTAHYEDGTILSQDSIFYWDELAAWGELDEVQCEYPQSLPFLRQAAPEGRQRLCPAGDWSVNR